VWLIIIGAVSLISYLIGGNEGYQQGYKQGREDMWRSGNDTSR
jgi:hypothetical protein